MWFLFLLGLALCAVSSSHEGVALFQSCCPKFMVSFNNRCFKYVATQMSWANAELYCLSQGANLVSIHSVEEENFVKTLIRNYDSYESPTWIGLTDAQQDGTWLWSDGSKFSFTNWNSGEPNNLGGNEECVHTNFGSAKNWNDGRCSDKFAFVCGTRSDCFSAEGVSKLCLLKSGFSRLIEIGVDDH